MRNGGRWSTSASSHSLLAVALLGSLRSFTAKQVNNLLARRTDGRKKVSLLVKSLDVEFIAGLKVPLKNRSGPLRAIRSLHQPLLKQMSRFDLSLEHDPRNNGILAVVDWAKKNVLPPDVENDARVLLPTAVNMLGRNFQDGGQSVGF